MCSIGRALSGENFSLADCELNPGDIACFQYALIVSVEVERSFSIYKSVLQSDLYRTDTFLSLIIPLEIHSMTQF